MPYGRAVLLSNWLVVDITLDAQSEMTASTTKALIPRSLMFGSLGLFACSLALPAYSIGCGGVFPGIFALLLGPIDLLALHLPWVANPLLLFSWLALRKHSSVPALALAVLAAGAAAMFWFGENKVVIAGASCSSKYIVLSGYFVWLMSIGTQIVAAATSLALGQGSEMSGEAHVESI